jgi:hypothetical protein
MEGLFFSNNTMIGDEMMDIEHFGLFSIILILSVQNRFSLRQV